LDALRIDTGLSGKAKVGDYAGFATKFRRVGPSIMSKSIDDRIGVATLIELLKQSPPNIDLCLAFSVQEEIGLRGAKVVESVCPYCAVGCGTNIYVKGDTVIDIEGNPRSPINEGTLCPKGANIFQLHHNPHRVKQVMWRAPFSDKWEIKPLDWAMDRIAHLVKEARERGYDPKSNAVTNIGALGGATLDNEENYLIKKFFGGALGLVSIENQARI
jgi:formate dehydrogenase major subunit